MMKYSDKFVPDTISFYYCLTCMKLHSKKHYQPDHQHVVTVKDKKRGLIVMHPSVYTTQRWYIATRSLKYHTLPGTQEPSPKSKQCYA